MKEGREGSLIVLTVKPDTVLKTSGFEDSCLAGLPPLISPSISASVTILLWKYNQTMSIAMTMVFPEPVAILNA